MNNRVKFERLEVSISKHIIRGQILLDEFVFDVFIKLLSILTSAVSESRHFLPLSKKPFCSATVCTWRDFLQYYGKHVIVIILPTDQTTSEGEAALPDKC